MKIVSVPTLILLLLCITICSIFFLSSLSLSVSQHHTLSVSEFFSMKKSSHLVVFLTFNVVVIAILMRSVQAIQYTIPMHGTLVTAGFEKDEMNLALPICAEQPFPLYAGEYAVESMKDHIDDNNDFLPRLVYVGYTEEKIKDDHHDDSMKDHIDDNNDFLPRLVYVGYTEDDHHDDSNDEYYHGYDGYDEDNDDDLDKDDDDSEYGEEEDDDLSKRIEDFIAKNNQKWTEEKLNDKQLYIEAAELQFSVAA
ncbi:unnamed protein product [Ilex paraguariensis]|uniref:Uncharacterized protein n=1 Tax=Ilex paraguariensis TaxID=185542 RepID=A0ABC8T4S4_9AQUA